MSGRVLQIFQPEVGGVPAYVAGLVDGLQARGWSMAAAGPAVALRDSPGFAEIPCLEVESSQMPERSDVHVVRALARFARQESVGLVHGHSTKAGLLAAAVGRLARLPSVYSPHAWAFQRQDPVPMRLAYAAIERQLVRHSHAAVIAVAHAERNVAERWHVAPRGRVQVVHTGVLSQPRVAQLEARAALGLPADAVIVAWIGRAGPQKGAQALPRIASLLAPAAQLVSLGGGLAESTLPDDLADHGGIVLGLGARPDTLLSAADVFIQTSQWEGLPLAVLEAMDVGLPVVAYGVGGVTEQVEHGETGYLVPPGDVEALAGHVLELVHDAAARRRMGAAAQARLHQRFSYSQMLDRIERAYRIVLGSPGSDREFAHDPLSNGSAGRHVDARQLEATLR
jgi:glycosyltransferase involved in cell wall biosynthesis